MILIFMNQENTNSCLKFFRYKKNKKNDEYHAIIEKIEDNHRESLQIIINCIDYVKENIQEINLKINKIEKKYNLDLNVKSRQRSNSI
jgi:hypothetical protein